MSRALRTLYPAAGGGLAGGRHSSHMVERVQHLAAEGAAPVSVAWLCLNRRAAKDAQCKGTDVVNLQAHLTLAACPAAALVKQ